MTICVTLDSIHNSCNVSVKVNAYMVNGYSGSPTHLILDIQGSWGTWVGQRVLMVHDFEHYQIHMCDLQIRLIHIYVNPHLSNARQIMWKATRGGSSGSIDGIYAWVSWDGGDFDGFHSISTEFQIIADYSHILKK